MSYVPSGTTAPLIQRGSVTSALHLWHRNVLQPYNHHQDSSHLERNGPFDKHPDDMCIGIVIFKLQWPRPGGAVGLTIHSTRDTRRRSRGMVQRRPQPCWRLLQEKHDPWNVLQNEGLKSHLHFIVKEAQEAGKWTMVNTKRKQNGMAHELTHLTKRTKQTIVCRCVVWYVLSN